MRREAGFTLLEVLVALFLIGIGVLGVAPMFIQATRGNATSADFGKVGARAVERLELLRAEAYDDLDTGGDLESNTSGYYDDTDPEVLVRWEIETYGSPPKTKQITVRAMAQRNLSGPQREVTVLTVRGD